MICRPINFRITTRPSHLRHSSRRAKAYADSGRRQFWKRTRGKLVDKLFIDTVWGKTIVANGERRSSIQTICSKALDEQFRPVLDSSYIIRFVRPSILSAYYGVVPVTFAVPSLALTVCVFTL